MADDRRQLEHNGGNSRDNRGVYHQLEPQSEEISQPYLLAPKHSNIHPHTVDTSPSCCPDCVPPCQWHVPDLYASTQEQCHATPYANQNPSGYEVWRNTRHDVPFTPTGAATMVQYREKETGAPPTIPNTYPQDDITWAGRNSCGASFAPDLQADMAREVGRGPTLGETNTHSWANTNGQYAPATENFRSSEFLRSLARQYILDPRTNVGTIHMEPRGNGVVEMIITIKVADTV
ncbi:hypothetical protein EDB89DRAFT_263504 [Lactarius sanguifluus]|nr:hypothetical protein EDB89DRAFT_263504 [Lactarius sanguifluus]